MKKHIAIPMNRGYQFGFIPGNMSRRVISSVIKTQIKSGQDLKDPFDNGLDSENRSWYEPETFFPLINAVSYNLSETSKSRKMTLEEFGKSEFAEDGTRFYLKRMVEPSPLKGEDSISFSFDLTTDSVNIAFKHLEVYGKFCNLYNIEMQPDSFGGNLFVRIPAYNWFLFLAYASTKRSELFARSLLAQSQLLRTLHTDSLPEMKEKHPKKFAQVCGYCEGKLTSLMDCLDSGLQIDEMFAIWHDARREIVETMVSSIQRDEAMKRWKEENLRFSGSEQWVNCGNLAEAVEKDKARERSKLRIARISPLFKDRAIGYLSKLLKKKVPFVEHLDYVLGMETITSNDASSFALKYDDELRFILTLMQVEDTAGFVKTSGGASEDHDFVVEVSKKIQENETLMRHIKTIFPASAPQD